MKNLSRVSFNGDKGTVTKIYTKEWQEFDKFCGIYFSTSHTERRVKVVLDKGRTIDVAVKYLDKV